MLTLKNTADSFPKLALSGDTLFLNGSILLLIVLWLAIILNILWGQHSSIGETWQAENETVEHSF